ncbi:MAG: hypothetical protein PXX73_01865 [Sideroxydans sp.]|nr:hypothetical protein [Sideroxydans sp.]
MNNSMRLSTLLIALLLTACAAPVKIAVQANDAQLAKYKELSALDIVSALEKNVAEAKTEGMPFTAPHYFKEATQTLSAAQNGLSSQPKDQLAQQAAKGDAILEKGRAIMAVVQYRFANELALKAQLDSLDTDKSLPKDYANVMGDFADLINVVEAEKADNIDKKKETLLKELTSLEVRSVQEGALHSSEVINDDSKSKNADKQVPASYAEAVRIYLDAKTKIAAAAHDKELVQRLSAQALFAARHAQQLNDRVTELQNQIKGVVAKPAVGVNLGGLTGVSINTQVGGAPAVEKGLIEKIAMQDEERLGLIGSALGYKDVRDLSIEKQAQELKRAATELNEQAKNEAGLATTKVLETRLQAASDVNKKATQQLADKDQLLAEKDVQISKLNEQITALEAARDSQTAATIKIPTVKKKQ